jgi:hypothetical protein
VTARQTGGARFLTLPFTDSRIVVQQGWIYEWGSEHRGIDYVLGGRDNARWQSFDVVAAADGWACGNCISRQGNAVWIEHRINDQTYYSYYGHLDTIEAFIPQGNQRNTVAVQRGQKIGVAGSTGSDSIHLHFQVSFAHTPVDPYDLWVKREPYAPGCQPCLMGPSPLWTTNPPSFASGGAPPAPPPAAPTSTRPPAPTATPRPPSCEVKFEQTVQGTITDAKPETRYCLTAAAGDWASIRMFASGGSPLDTYLKLYGPDGKLLAEDDDGAQVDGNSFLVTRLPQAGRYEIVASRFAGAGGYRLRVEKGSKSALGDINRDCIVENQDIQLMAAAMDGTDANADLNLDGAVNAQDEQTMLYRLGRGCMYFPR